MVTHSSTSRPVQCLCMAERTGCPVFTDLWSYVHVKVCIGFKIFVFIMQGKSIGRTLHYCIAPLNYYSITTCMKDIRSECYVM